MLSKAVIDIPYYCKEPLSADTIWLAVPSFELWLQCIFIPNAQHAASSGQYPQNSQVGAMAMRQ